MNQKKKTQTFLSPIWKKFRKLSQYVSGKNSIIGGDPKKPMTLKNALMIILLAGMLLLVLLLPASNKNSHDGMEITAEDILLPASGNAIGTADGSDMIQSASTQKNVSADIALYDYRTELTKELESILGVMDGAGKIHVMLTLESDGKIVVEKDLSQQSAIQDEDDGKGGKRQNSSSQSTQSTIYADNASTPFVTQTLTPHVSGVVIAAEGGDNPVVQKNITEAICALFDMQAHKIRVVKMAKP